MLYTYPHYYREFRCLAGECEDTCCAGWAIAIDEKSLARYGRVKGPFGNRLHNSIDWREGTFCQYEGRCAFLNEENLCDLYAELGKGSLCRTCRLYPRHIEEFEGCWELSLCISCPEAARLVLGQRERVSFLTREDEREESYEEFDFFLYTKLGDARERLFEILQDRGLPLRLRAVLCLGLAHDLQARIERERLWEADRLIERYGRADRGEYAERRLWEFARNASAASAVRNGSDAQDLRGAAGNSGPMARFAVMNALYDLLGEMETLKADWPGYRDTLRQTVFVSGAAAYEERLAAFRASEAGAEFELWGEQLAVYFVYTYFCGAVYNGNPLGKMKLTAAALLIARDMALALWLEKKSADLRTFADVVHRFSRELEHSDENKLLLEEALTRRPEFSFRALMAAFSGGGSADV